MIRRLIDRLLSRLFPYKPRALGKQILARSIMETTRR